MFPIFLSFCSASSFPNVRCTRPILILDLHVSCFTCPFFLFEQKKIYWHYYFLVLYSWLGFFINRSSKSTFLFSWSFSSSKNDIATKPTIVLSLIEWLSSLTAQWSVRRNNLTRFVELFACVRRGWARDISASPIYRCFRNSPMDLGKRTESDDVIELVAPLTDDADGLWTIRIFHFQYLSQMIHLNRQEARVLVQYWSKDDDWKQPYLFIFKNTFHIVDGPEWNSIRLFEQLHPFCQWFLQESRTERHQNVDWIE